MQADLAGTRYEWSRTVRLPVERAAERAREVLEEQGFTVLADVDLGRFLSERLTSPHPPMRILSAFHPEFCHRALAVDPDCGPLLPCTVIVREREGQTEVAATDEEWLAAASPSEPLHRLAVQVNKQVRWALELM